MGRIRRFAIIAACAVIAGLVGAAVLSALDEGRPAPIVWRDHVADPTTTSTR